VCGLCPSSGNVNTGKYDVSESGPVPVFRRREGIIYSVGSFRKSKSPYMKTNNQYYFYITCISFRSPSIIRIIKSRRAGHVARMGEKRKVYRLLVGKPEGKRPLGRQRRRWIDNIKKDLLRIGLSVVGWIGLAQDRYRWRALVKAVMNLRVP
jgi:hypothetical protein